MYINNKLYLNDIERILTKDFEALKNKKIYITGASGLIGSCLVDLLMYLNLYSDFNTDIYANFTSMNSAETRFPSYINNKLFHCFVHDINNKIEMDENIDYIIHTASNTHPKLYATKPVETIKLNTSGTLNILDFAINNPNCRVLFLSTLEVYGENPNIEKYKENDIFAIDFMRSRACYPESKRLCETMCYAYAQEYGLNFSIARLGYIYGHTVKMDSSKADVQFLNNALNSEDIVMKSQGLQKRSYCYVLDVVSALLTILIKGLNGETYNVAAESGNITLRQYAETLAKISGVNLRFELPTEQEKQGYSTIANSTLDSSKLIDLGWNSKFTLEEGIEHTLEIKKDLLCLKV